MQGCKECERAKRASVYGVARWVYFHKYMDVQMCTFASNGGMGIWVILVTKEGIEVEGYKDCGYHFRLP